MTLPSVEASRLPTQLCVTKLPAYLHMEMMILCLTAGRIYLLYELLQVFSFFLRSKTERRLGT
jgi:hypothetical protein